MSKGVWQQGCQHAQFGSECCESPPVGFGGALKHTVAAHGSKRPSVQREPNQERWAHAGDTAALFEDENSWGGDMMYREHKGITYEVHYPERNQKLWGFGFAKLGESATVRFGERMAANEVWSRYRTLCAEGEPFDVALEYRGEHVDPSVILAVGRLASGECNSFALWVPARQQLKVASG